MEWIDSLFTIHSAVQTLVVLALIISVGMALGKLRIRGISLGVAFVFFMGIVAGSLHFTADEQMISFAETFGLSLFVYALGLHVGPNFIGMMRHDGASLNGWGLGVIVLGTVMALSLCLVLPISIPDMVGILCGATTNTPALGAAQQALATQHISSSGAALGCAVTYPLGVVGVIFAMILLRKFLVRKEDLERCQNSDDDSTYVGQFICVNPAISDKTIAQISQSTHRHFIISRIWRNGQVIVPVANTVIKMGDSLLVVTSKEDEDTMVVLFGKQVEKDWNGEQIDWNAIDSNVESRVCVVTRRALNGRHLGQLQLRHTYGVNVSRVLRGDIKLLASDDLRLQYGDRVTVVGRHDAVDNAEHFFGNSVKTLEKPNIGSIFLGIVLGLLLGAIPVNLPGMESPIRLGIAGGPIIMGIIVGALGPRMHFISYTTRSASLMLRSLGLALYLACLGLVAGKDFFATVVRPEGLLWVGIGLLITVVPTIVVGVIALHKHKYDFGTVCGIMCGSMANPMALGYANDTLKGDTASISYASVYPMGMFVRVVIAQLLIMFLAN